jgi:penicillin amidase
MYHTTIGEQYSRIARIRQMLDAGKSYTIEDLRKMQLDALSLRGQAEIPLFQGWSTNDPDTERARDMIAKWNAQLMKDSVPAALYVTWDGVADAAARNQKTPKDQRQKLIEDGLKKAIAKLNKDFGPDWAQWRYGRINFSAFPHPLLADFDLPAVERNGGFGTVAATGVSFRHVMDPTNWDNSVFTITPGQSGQPESPFYGSLLARWANDEYFPLSYSRAKVDEHAKYRLTLSGR